MSITLPERPLHVSPSLAATIGLEAALLYQLLCDWHLLLEGRRHQGQTWYLLTKQQLLDHLPFWEWPAIEIQLRQLHGQGLIILGSTVNDNAKNLRFALVANNTQEHAAESRAQATVSHDPLFGQQAIPANWRPDPAAIDYLTRFNRISDAFIERILPEFIAHYRENGETRSAWSSTFSQFALRRWKKQQYNELEQAKQQHIDQRWQPSQDAWDILLRDGIMRDFIEDAIPEFILYWRERGTLDSNWNSRFLQHVRLQWARYQNTIASDDEFSPITADWQPSPEVFDILGMARIDADFARQQLNEFVLYWRDSGQAHRSWNTKFLQHVKYRWANNHHFGQNDARHQGSTGRHQPAAGFLEKHTDRSWAEGL